MFWLAALCPHINSSLYLPGISPTLKSALCLVIKYLWINLQNCFCHPFYCYPAVHSCLADKHVLNSLCHFKLVVYSPLTADVQPAEALSNSSTITTCIFGDLQNKRLTAALPVRVWKIQVRIYWPKGENPLYSTELVNTHGQSWEKGFERRLCSSRLQLRGRCHKVEILSVHQALDQAANDLL